MASSGSWSTIHAERAALAADLADLSPELWQTRSLAADWNLQQALAHMVATAKMTPMRFIAHFAGAGFKFHKMSARDVADESRGTPAETLAEFRRVANRRTSPPGPADTWLAEVIVHSEDIRRPLGIKREYPTDALVRVADFFKKSDALIGAKSRIAGLRLTATDTAWTNGDGPEVSGPILSLVMAMTGRAAAVDDLAGDGVAMLRERMP